MLVSDTGSLFVIALSDEPSQSLLSHLPTAFRFLTDATAPNTKNSCFVHCYFGRSRSVAVVLAFLMYDARFRWTLKQSLDYMQTLKPFAVVLCFLAFFFPFFPLIVVLSLLMASPRSAVLVVRVFLIILLAVSPFWLVV